MRVFVYRFNLLFSEAKPAFLSVIQIMQSYAAMASKFQPLSIEYLPTHYGTEKVASKLD